MKKSLILIFYWRVFFAVGLRMRKIASSQGKFIRSWLPKRPLNAETTVQLATCERHSTFCCRYNF